MGNSHASGSGKVHPKSVAPAAKNYISKKSSKSRLDGNLNVKESSK